MSYVKYCDVCNQEIEKGSASVTITVRVSPRRWPTKPKPVVPVDEVTIITDPSGLSDAVAEASEMQRLSEEMARITKRSRHADMHLVCYESRFEQVLSNLPLDE